MASDFLRDKAEAAGLRAELMLHEAPHHTPEDTPLVQALMKIYTDYTGREAACVSMGGGTYARHFKNAISFGTEIPAEPLPDFVGKIHTADEGIGIERLKMSLKVYILALHRLMQIEF